MTAFVFNCAYNGLSIIQELGRKGIDVYAIDSFRNVGTTSRYGTYLKSPNPTESEREFIDFLVTAGQDFENKPVLFPTNDHWVSAVSKHRKELSQYFEPCFSDQSTVDLLLDKRKFSQWALEQGYPVPRSWTPEEVRNVSEEMFPIIAKRGDGRYRPDIMHRSGFARKIHSFLIQRKDPKQLNERYRKISAIRLEVINNRSELEEFLDEHESVLENLVFEEYVKGMSDQMYTVGIYANQGTIKAMFTGRKVRGYPPDIGDCKVGEMQSVPSHVEETVKTMCDKLGYHGIAEFEFKRDLESGEFYLIEINPRSWSWIGITPACGVNLPWLAYQDLTGRKTIEFETQICSNRSIIWVKASEDLLNCLAFYRWSYPDWHCGPKQWWQSVSSDTLVLAEGSREDPIPILYSIVLIFRRIVVRAMNQQSQ